MSEVELRSVAGREAHGLASVREAPRELGRTVEVERHPLPHLDRSQPVRGADEDEIHPKCPVCRLSWSAITSAKPTNAV